MSRVQTESMSSDDQPIREQRTGAASPLTNARGQSQNLFKVKPVWNILFGRFTVNETMTSNEDRKLNIPMTLSPHK